MLNTFICILYGMIIGGGAILPGISGGVLCVAFGLYRPMMEFLENPMKSLRENSRILIPLGIGWLIGFWIFAKIIVLMFRASEFYATWLFIGLIIGTVPGLIRESGREGRNQSSWVSLVAGFILFLSILLYIQYGELPQIAPSPGWFGFCGALWGFSLIIPGMSSSSTLMAIGLYEVMTNGLATFDPTVILPWLIGLAGIIAVFSRLVNRLFRTHYSIFFHFVLGLVLASTIAIIPLHYSNLTELLFSLLCCSVGFFAAWILERLQGGQIAGGADGRKDGA